MPINIPENITSKFPKVNEKNRNWIFGGILLAIFLGDYFLLMQPLQLRNLMKINSEIGVMQKDLAQGKTDIQRRAQYEEQLEELKAKKKMMANMILSEEEIPLIMENISHLARKNNIRINQIMPLKDTLQKVLDTEDGTYLSLPILVNSRGGYHDLGRFINDIENDKIFMSILAFDIAGSGDDPKNHSARITIKAFVVRKK